MIYSIENDCLKISVNSAGAQLWSMYSKKTQTEYLWQGDPAYWTGRAYNLFPFIGRMYEGKYLSRGEEYSIRIHGVARYNEFTLESQTADTLTFLLTDNEETRKEYPYVFAFRAIFKLCGSKLKVSYKVTNNGDDTLYCGFGGHPGINVPFGKGAFEEYYLDFGEKTNVEQQLLVTGGYMADKSVPYALKDGVKLPLKHELFDEDAVILGNTSGYVAIRCDKEERYVSMEFSDFPYIGFWHMAKKDAPYVCLEPWSVLPASNGKKDEIESKAGMTNVAPNMTEGVSYTLEIHE